MITEIRKILSTIYPFIGRQMIVKMAHELVFELFADRILQV